MTSAKTLNSKTERKIEKFKTGPGYSPTKCFVIYREQMLKLLAFPKPAHAQLCIELPALMGFRAKEVTTWRAEYIDYEHGDTLVLDAKKHKLFQIPLNIQVASHAASVLKGRTEGYVLRSRSHRNQGDPLTPTAVWYTWRKWATKARLFNWEEFSPLRGRQFFAAEWFHRQRLSLMTLSMMMRHSEARVTLGYVRNLVFYEDIRRDYKEFQLAFASEDLEVKPQKVKVST